MTNDRFTIRCAVYLFLIKDNKLFLLRRKNTGWMDGMYGVPAGHLEKAETIREAMVREAKEEAGVDVNADDLKLVHTMYRRTNFDYIDLHFTVSSWQGTPTNAEQDKADDAQWFLLTTLPENMIENQKIALENLQKGIAFSEHTF